MSLTLVFHPAARTELVEAVDFYDTESPGLGGDFIAAVERAVLLIIDQPAASPIALGRVRRRLVTRFPYSVLYSASDRRVTVWAIAHHSRRPFYWRSRT